MRSKYNRTLTGCWNREQIEASIAERQAELDGNEPKSATRIRHLKTKLAKLRAALENGTTVGGNIMPQKRTKVAKSGRDGGVHKRAKTKRRVKLICFKCRKRGHTLQDCQGDAVGICFRCGAKDHILRDCNIPDSGSLPYTTCFICQKTGHIASQCPENKNGIYPNGGACFFCGSIDHRKIDCPERKNNTKSLQTPRGSKPTDSL